MATKLYDAIVIGSGITGGWAAKELTEKGLEVLLLEAGRTIDPNIDYSEHKMPFDVRYRGLTDLKFMEENYPIQRQCYACREYNYRPFRKGQRESLHHSRRQALSLLPRETCRRAIHHVGPPGLPLE